MSLVNEMLRDLDKRKRGSPQVTRINKVFSPRRKPEPELARKQNFLVLATVSITLGLAGGYILFRQTSATVFPAAIAAPVSAVQPVEGKVLREGMDSEVRVAPVVDAYADDSAQRADSNVVQAVVDPGNNTITIVEEASENHGFTLRITADKPLPFTTLHRSATSFTLRLEQVGGIKSQQVNGRGISLLQSDGGVTVEYSSDQDTDFQLYEDANTVEFDLVLNGRARHVSVSAPMGARQVSEAGMQDWYANGSAYMPTAHPQAAAGSAALPTVQPEYWQAPKAVKAFPQTTPVRVARELPLEQRDARNSQQAIALVQNGQLFDAYQGLISFISDNPQAHLSRETLATVLVAQNEYTQAETVIDEGLQQVPHYGPFKKIKARLLMQQASPEDALELLRSLPPPIESDAEYFELLAMLYQQTGDNALALATWQSLLRIDGKQGRWWAGMGISLEAMNRNADALASYQAASVSPGLDAGLQQFSVNKIRTLSTTQ